MQETYPLALGLNACRTLGIDPIDMLHQAGLGDLERQLAARARTSNMSARVSSALLTQLPSGKADVVTVCQELSVSRSTLQRRLRDEDTTFQQILDTKRKYFALRYLTKSLLTNKEISFLLAYSDPNSFYRSFRRWTGLSPSEVRESADGVGK